METSTCTKCGATKTQAVAALGVPECQCPAGTIHLAGEADCGGTGCECEKNVAGVRVEGIAVTNREGVVNFNEMVTRFTTAFNHNELTNSQRTWMKDNLKEVKIVSSNSVAVNLSDNILTIRNNLTWSDIKDYLGEWFWNNSITMLHQLNNPEETLLLQKTYKHA